MPEVDLERGADTPHAVSADLPTEQGTQVEDVAVNHQNTPYSMAGNAVDLASKHSRTSLPSEERPRGYRRRDSNEEVYINDNDEALAKLMRDRMRDRRVHPDKKINFNNDDEWTSIPPRERLRSYSRRYITETIRSDRSDTRRRAEAGIEEKSADEDIGTRSKTRIREKSAHEVNGPLLERLRSLYEDSIIDVKGDHIRLNVAEFNRVALECAQKRVVDLIFKFVNDIDYGKSDASDVQDFTDHAQQYLTDYVSAWKNLQFMTATAKERGFDPFIISSDYKMQRKLLQDAWAPWDKRNRDRRHPSEPSQQIQGLDRLTEKYGLSDLIDEKPVRHFGNATRTSTIRKEMIEQYTRNVGMAMTGGAFLIGPMLVMVLHPGLTTSLITTSVCVFAFGLVMAVSLTAPFDVLSATAAYAAVLVVFIGTGGGS